MYEIEVRKDEIIIRLKDSQDEVNLDILEVDLGVGESECLDRRDDTKIRENQ